MVTEEEKEIVLERISNLPANMKLSVGSGEPISKPELIEHIKKGDRIGDKFVQIQLNFLREIAKEYG